MKILQTTIIALAIILALPAESKNKHPKLREPDWPMTLSFTIPNGRGWIVKQKPHLHDDKGQIIKIGMQHRRSVKAIVDIYITHPSTYGVYCPQTGVLDYYNCLAKQTVAKFRTKKSPWNGMMTIMSPHTVASIGSTRKVRTVYAVTTITDGKGLIAIAVCVWMKRYDKRYLKQIPKIIESVRVK